MPRHNMCMCVFVYVHGLCVCVKEALSLLEKLQNILVNHFKFPVNTLGD